MAKVSFNSQDDVDALVASAVETALVPIREQHSAEIAALNATILKLQTLGAAADYSAFEKHPDLIDLLKSTDLRPSALPALCTLAVWNGARKSSDIVKIIPVTPKMGDEKGGKPSTAKMISAALQKAETALYSANKGVGIKVTSISKSDGDSDIKRIRFPIVVTEDFDAPEVATQGEGTGADGTGMISAS